ncbi:MAG TPA: DinB family protein [Roseiflexaceae bacterium]|nr:DinB family protein [Roseiflexaceae bacterium]
MSENSTSLATFYKGWDRYQEHLVRAVAPLSAEQLAMSPAPHLRSIGVLVAHIIAARVWWFHYVLGEGGDDLASLATWDDDDQPARTADELVRGLEATWQVIWTALERWTPADLVQIFPRPRAPERTYSRQWIIWHVIEHDVHHGGELSYALGMHGVAGIDL